MVAQFKDGYDGYIAVDDFKMTGCKGQPTTPPEITVPPAPLDAFFRTEANTYCFTYGNPQPQTTWLFNNMLIRNTRHYNYSFTDSFSGLGVRDMQPHDEGSYTCMASNGIQAVTATTTARVKVGGCDFEAPSLCGWLQSVRHDTFNWTRVRGGTPSYDTGPIGDHTTGYGYYVYLESSSPRRQGDTAILESPWMKTTNTMVCVMWLFHGP